MFFSNNKENINSLKFKLVLKWLDFRLWLMDTARIMIFFLGIVLLLLFGFLLLLVDLIWLHAACANIVEKTIVMENMRDTDNNCLPASLSRGGCMC